MTSLPSPLRQEGRNTAKLPGSCSIGDSVVLSLGVTWGPSEPQAN